MASVSTKNSDQWHASLRIWKEDSSLPEGGRWTRSWKATGIPASEPKARAVKVAEALQEAAAAVHPSNLRRGDQRAFAAALESIWEAAGLSVPRVSATWADFVPQFIDSCTVNTKTRKLYESQLGRFTAHLGAKARGVMHNINHADCQAFYDKLLKDGRALKTVRTYLKMVRAAFDRAVKLGIIGLNPASLVKTPLGPAGNRQPLTRAEVAAVLQVLDNPPPDAVHCRGFLYEVTEEWKTMVLFGLWCGMRMGDACRRKWSDIEGDTITFVPRKKIRYGVPVTLPLVGALRVHLAGLKREGDDITPRLNGHQKLSVNFGKILDLAGVSAERTEAIGKSSKPKRRKSFHSLRHTVLTELAKSGADKQLRQLLADHDDPAVNSRYTHAEVERLASALAKAFPEAEQGD